MEGNVKTNTQAERLKLLTMRLKITTRDLSKLIGLNENTLYKINSGLMDISDRTASKICYFLEQEKGVVVNRQWLLSGDGDMIDEKHSVTPYDGQKETIPVAAEESEVFCANYKEKYFALLEKYTSLQEEHSELLKKMLQS